MKLKYIGPHGDMGLCRCEIYEVSIYTDDAIIVQVFDQGTGNKIATIPYSSPQTLADHWEKP